MAKQQQENEFEKRERENIAFFRLVRYSNFWPFTLNSKEGQFTGVPHQGENRYKTRFEDFDGWNPETAEVLNDLLRALRRKKGFSLFFVQCSPARGKRVMQAIRKCFPQKRLVQFELNRQSETLYWDLKERYHAEAFEVACVTGVEQAMYSYEDTKQLAGWSSKEIHNYSWKGVPPLLSHLNLGREVFEANLPIVLIFFVPSFVIDYFVQRAPDFLDWRSGFFKFVESSENLRKASQELVDKEYDEYLTLSRARRMEKIAEITEKLIQIEPSECEMKSNLLREQGRLFQSGKDYGWALDCYERAIAEDCNNYKAWTSKGSLFDDQQRYEEAIKSYDRAIEIKDDYFDAWANKGDTLQKLERYEEGIESYDRAIEIKDEYYVVWTNRGDALLNLQRYEEAIASYDRAIKIKNEYFDAWKNKGNALCRVGQYKKAIDSYDRATKIQPKNYVGWANMGFTAQAIQSYEKAIDCFYKALEVIPEDSRYYTTVLRNRATLLQKIGNKEEAISSYKKIPKCQAKHFLDLFIAGGGMYYYERYEDAVASYDKAIELIEKIPEKKTNWFFSLRYQVSEVKFKSNPSYLAFYGRSLALWKMGRYKKALESIKMALLLPDLYQDVSKAIITITIGIFQGKFRWHDWIIVINGLFRFFFPRHE